MEVNGGGQRMEAEEDGVSQRPDNGVTGVKRTLEVVRGGCDNKRIKSDMSGQMNSSGEYVQEVDTKVKLESVLQFDLCVVLLDPSFVKARGRGGCG